MATYILRQDAFWEGALRSKGERVTWDGPPEPHMAPAPDDDGKTPAGETKHPTLSSPRLTAAPTPPKKAPKQGD